MRYAVRIPTVLRTAYLTAPRSTEPARGWVLLRCISARAAYAMHIVSSVVPSQLHNDTHQTFGNTSAPVPASHWSATFQPNCVSRPAGNRFRVCPRTGGLPAPSACAADLAFGMLICWPVRRVLCCDQQAAGLPAPLDDGLPTHELPGFSHQGGRRSILYFVPCFYWLFL